MVFRMCGELRYRANRTKDVLFYTRAGFMDLALSHPLNPKAGKEKESGGMKIARVKITSFQSEKFLAEIIWTRKERGIQAQYLSGKLFNTAKEARNYLNEYIDLDRYKKELVC